MKVAITDSTNPKKRLMAIFYDNQGNFIVESGDFKVFVGGSSKTILEDKFNLQWDISQ